MGHGTTYGTFANIKSVEVPDMDRKRKVVIKEVPVIEIDEIPEDMTEEIERCLAECEEVATRPRRARMSGLADLFSKLKR